MLPIFFTRFESRKPITKSYWLGDDGRIVKTPAASMTDGQAFRVALDFDGFGATLDAATASHAFCYGLHDADVYGPQVGIAIAAKAAPPATLARTRAYFDYRPTPGVLMIDHDPSADGPSLNPEALRAALAAVCPGFSAAACWVRGSVSAGVHLQGSQPDKGKGFHVYLPVVDASDIPRFGKALFARLWLAGHGFIAISAAGSFLVRGLIDAAVFDGERLDFVGCPVVGAGLAYTPPPATHHDGGYLDTRALPDLDDAEQEQFETLVALAKKAREPDQKVQRAKWEKTHIKAMTARGVPERSARTQLGRLPVDGKPSDLYRDFPLEFAAQGLTTVGDVLANPAYYDDTALADPYEGVEYGRTTAKFYANRNGKPVIHSHAHGGARYFLKNTAGPAPRTPRNSMEGVAAILTKNSEADQKPCESAGTEAARMEFERLIAELANDPRTSPERGEALAVTVHASALSDAGKDRLIGQICKVTGHRKNTLKPKKAKPADFDDDKEGGAGSRAARVPSYDDRPDVDIGADRKVIAMIHAEQIIFGDKPRHPPYFRHESTLVRLQTVTRYRRDGVEITYKTVVPVDKDWLAGYLQTRIRFMKWSAQSKQWQPVNLPVDYAQGYIASTDWDAPVLSGLAFAPFIRRDGTICHEAGYDPKTRIYLDTAETWILPKAWKKGEKIDPATDNHVQRAKEVLYNVFESFNPASFADAAAPISHILSGLCKHMIGPVPVLTVTTPSQGSGKGKVMDIISGVLTGKRLATLIYNADETEFRKELATMLMGIPPLVGIGEVEGRVKSKVLNECLTQDTVNLRLLGQNKFADIEAWRSLFMFAGNNFTLTRDLARRSVRFRIDPGVARPEDREFARDEPAWSMANRTRIVAAALTILAAYLHQGRPNPPKDLGSYEEWSRTVRGAMLWAGFADPVETQKTWAGHDEETLLMGRVFAAWHGMMGKARWQRGVGWNIPFTPDPAKDEIRGEVSAAIIIKLAMEYAEDTAKPDAREFLDAIAGIKDCYDSKKNTYKHQALGYKLRAWCDKVALFEGETGEQQYKLISCGTRQNYAYWRVDQL